jgi:hypothetical protein
VVVRKGALAEVAGALDGRAIVVVTAAAEGAMGMVTAEGKTREEARAMREMGVRS